MFDDQPIDKQGTVPGNLPIGEPEDIFAGDSDGVLGAGADSADTTIDTPTNSALDVGVLKTKATPSAPRANPPASESSTQSVGSGFSGGQEAEAVADFGTAPIRKPSVLKSILIILIVILGLSAVGAGAWWIIKKANFIWKKAPEAANLPVDTGATDETANTVQPAENSATDLTATGGTVAPEAGPAESASNTTDGAILFGDNTDTDGDGIPDVQEKALDTDANNWDTDGDGLSDGDEVNIWHTNPKNPDTDGDGYKDGDEVKNGYNPNGSGKIFAPPVSGTSTNK